MGHSKALISISNCCDRLESGVMARFIIIRLEGELKLLGITRGFQEMLRPAFPEVFYFILTREHDMICFRKCAT